MENKYKQNYNPEMAKKSSIWLQYIRKLLFYMYLK